MTAGITVQGREIPGTPRAREADPALRAAILEDAEAMIAFLREHPEVSLPREGLVWQFSGDQGLPGVQRLAAILGTGATADGAAYRAERRFGWHGLAAYIAYTPKAAEVRS